MRKSAPTRRAALRLLCAMLRSPVSLHRRQLLSPAAFPRLLPLLLWELGGEELRLQLAAARRELDAAAAALSPRPVSAGPAASALSGPLELEQCTKVEGAAQDQASGPAAAPAAIRPSAAARSAQRVLL
jgi:hypothetical protein